MVVSLIGGSRFQSHEQVKEDIMTLPYVFSQLDHIELGFFPTPLHSLPRLTQALNGPNIFIKRDDQTGLATGGNKTRKLEYLIGQALAQGADTVLTAGAVQSNHCRQTAAAAARAGLQCHLVLRGERPSLITGNTLLDQLVGAKIHLVAPKTDMLTALEELALTLKTEGHHPYVIPYGGSNSIGAAAYAAAMFELQDQLQEMDLRIDYIVFASSSGGTQSGLVVGAEMTGFEGHILGISVDKKAGALQSLVADIANGTADLLDVPRIFNPRDILVNDNYIGGGYGVMSQVELNAMRQVARFEGVLVDPVYTGRAFAGLIDLVQQKYFKRDENVLFWHTGGTSGIFGYAQRIAELS